LLRRYLFGEHRSGRPGERRYLTLKEFETAYAVFRGQLAQGIDPQPAPSAGSGRRRRLSLAAPVLVEEEAPTMVPAEQAPESLRKLFPQGYASGSVSALLAAEYFQHHGPHLAPKTLRGYKETSAKHLIPRFGFVPLRSLTTQEIRQALSEISSMPSPTCRASRPILA
jgi:hypothetical protein